MIDRYSSKEKASGFFVLATLGILLLTILTVAAQQDWLSRNRHFSIIFKNGEGLLPGAIVQMSGIRIGKVDEVTINEDNQIEVSIEVDAQYADRVRTDSVAKTSRLSLIGDKIIVVSPGSKDALALQDRARLADHHST